MSLPRLFVVSPFGKPDTSLWKQAEMILEDYIRPASEPQFQVVRADKISTERITSALLWELDNDPMVVAYLGPTEPFSPNVLFEIGYRAGSRKPLLMIKHQDTKLPFDLADYQMVELPPIDNLGQENGDRDDALREQVKMQLDAKSFRHVDSAYAIAEVAFDISRNEPKTHVFTAASEDANRLFHMPEGKTLIGADPIGVMKSLECRVAERQWKKFHREQDALIGAITKGGARTARATIPFIFSKDDIVDEALRGRAFLAIVTDSAFVEDALRMRILYLECTNLCRWSEDENCYICVLEGLEEIIDQLALQLGPIPRHSA
jgi:hypothetical protein